MKWFIRALFMLSALVAGVAMCAPSTATTTTKSAAVLPTNTLPEMVIFTSWEKSPEEEMRARNLVAPNGLPYELGVDTLPEGYIFSSDPTTGSDWLSCHGQKFELSLWNNQMKVILPTGQFVTGQAYEFKTRECHFALEKSQLGWKMYVFQP